MNSPRHFRRAMNPGMSLVEVVLAIGILSFCAVSLMGLLPGMLNATRESRATAVVGRIYQTVSLNLTENSSVTAGPWYFNQEGLQLPDGTTGDYKVSAAPPIPAAFGSTANSNIHMVLVTIENVTRGSTNLVRPIFIEDASLPSP